MSRNLSRQVSRLFTAKPSRQRASASRASRRRGPWALEGLEDRVMLSGTPTYYTVNLTSDTGASSGTDATTGDPSGDLLWAVSQANANTNTAGSVINFDPTVFASSTTIALSSTLQLSDTKGPEVIDGPGANLLTISGQNLVGVFTVGSKTTATLSGLTIANGNPTSGDGGGINNAGSLTVDDSTISKNSAGSAGAGIYSTGSLTLSDSTLLNNSSASIGGGLYNSGTATVTNGTIADNTTENYGGGLDNYGTLTVTNSTIADNTASQGGGLGLFGTETIVNSTIAYNRSSSSLGGGGIYGESYNLSNTIVALNTDSHSGAADDIAGGDVFSGAYNLIGAAGTSGLTNGKNGNLVGVANPELGPLADNGGPTQTIALLSGSPAIDAGDTALAVDSSGNSLVYDQRGPGFPRVIGESVDIGAFEWVMLSSQQITFGPIADQSYGASITLTATASSGLPVSYTVLSGPATLSGGDVLTMTGVGTVTVEASQAGNADYDPATPVDQSFAVIAGPPTVYTVDATTDSGAGAGNEGDLLYCVTLANANTNLGGSEIEFDPSVFASTTTITLTSTLTLSESAGPEVIAGPGANLLTVSGGNKVGVFTVSSKTTATLSGLTIAYGNTTSGGGGGISNAGSLTVDDSTLSNNSASYGAGIYSSGSLTLNDSTVSSNTAGSGAGIYSNGSSLTLNDSTLSDNYANSGYGNGGAIYSSGAALTLNGTTLSSNSSAYRGGGISVGSGSVTLTDSTLSNNSAFYGGGIFTGGHLTLNSSTLSNNFAYYGGAIDSASALSLTNSTIADNSAEDVGGGLDDSSTATIVNSTIAYNEVLVGSGGGGGIYAPKNATTLYNTIVAINTDGPGGAADDIAGGAVSSSSEYNLIGAAGTSGLTNGTNGNLVGVTNPELGPLANYGGPTETVALLAGSHAIDAGDTALAVDTSGNQLLYEQRGPGYPRVNGAAVDIGAFEWVALPSQQITFGPIAQQVYGTSITLAATASSGLPVSFTVLSGPATLSDGDVLTMTGVGTVTVEASQAGNTDYAPAAPVDQSLMVIAGPPTAYTVDATTDSGAGVGNEGDLLYCITLANANTNPGGSVINFDPTVFASSTTITLTSTLTLSESAGPEVIDGPGASVLTISGGNAVGVFRVNSGTTATLSGLTIAKGNMGAASGGGIYNQGTLTIDDSTLSNNFANLGAGIFSTGSITLNDSTLSNNSATYSANGFGGGIDSDGSLTVNDSTLSNNSAYVGGGIYSESTLSLTNSTIADNAVSGFGAGLEIYGAATIVNSTIAYNEVESGSGGGAGISESTNSTTLYNTIVALNTDGPGGVADDIAGGAASSSSAYNLIGAGGTSGLTSGTNHNQVGVANPELGSLAWNGGPTQTIALLAGSPAIDAGDTALAVDSSGNALAYDQRGSGFSRVVGTSVDIGAFESGNFASQSIAFGPIDDQVYGASITLTATASSGLPVSYNVTGPATLSGGDILAMTGVGTVTVVASQAGDADFAAANSVSESFSVAQASQSINFGPIADQIYGASITLIATSSSGLPVSYNMTGPATLSDGGVLEMSGVGTVTVVASQAGNADFTPANSVSESFSVTQASQSIDLGTIADQIYGASITLPATASSGLPVSYNVTGPATLSDDDVLTMTGLGTVTVVATQAGDADYAPAATVNESFTVNQASQTIDLGPIADQVDGASITLPATTSLGLPISYTVTGPATLSDDDVLTMTGLGPVTVIATQAGDADYAPADPVVESFQSIVAGSPTIYTVDAITDSDAGSGNEGDLLYCITLANTNDNPDGSEIEFDPSVFNAITPQIVTVTNTLLMQETPGPEFIVGPGATVLTISGGNSVGVLNVSSGTTATISELTIANGSTEVGGFEGGGINNEGSLTIDYSTLSNNTAFYGGAIYNGSGSLTLNYSTLSNNSAYYGGGLWTGYVDDGEPLGSADLVNSTVSNNSAVWGAGIYNGNHLSLTNCTVAYNTASREGEGAGGGGISALGGTATLYNTIVALNTDADGTPDDIYGAVSSSSAYNLIGSDGSGGLINGTTSGNQVGVTDPGLASGLAWNGGPTETIALLTGSPAINAGDTALALDSSGNSLAYDQRGSGYARVIGAAVDIGAFEAAFTQASQSIDLGPIADQVYGASITLPATASSGLQVSYTVTGPATLSADDVLTMTGLGTVTVVATQAGDDEYTPATTVNDSFSVTQASQSIDFGPIAGQFEGASVTLTAVASSGLPVSYTLLSGPATLSGGDVLTVTGVGSITVEATQAGNADYTPANVDQSFQSYVVGAPPDVYTVDAATDSDTGSGNEGDLLYCITQANNDGNPSGSVINFSPTVFASTTTITLTSTLTLSEFGGPEVIDGPGANILTVSGGYDVGVFYVSSGTTATLSGLTIAYGTSTYGAGVFIDGGSLNLNHSTIESNTAYAGGGGIFAGSGGSVTMSFATIEHNYAGYSGGGVQSGNPTGDEANLGGGSLNVSNSTIEGNSSNWGGGVFIWYGSMSMSASAIEDNSGFDGGGLTMFSSSLTMNDSTIEGNSTPGPGSFGGGVFSTSSSLTMSDSTIEDNSAAPGAGGSGGGLAGSAGDILTMDDESAIEDNSASGGGGIYVSSGGSPKMSGSLSMNNATIEGNSAAVGGGLYVASGSVYIGDSTIADNSSSYYGGGVYIQSGYHTPSTLSLTNSTVADNTAAIYGGGIFNDGTATIVNSTIAYNEVEETNGGGGIYAEAGSTTLNNTIVALNTDETTSAADDIYGAVSSSSAYNLIGTGGSGGLINGTTSGNQVGVTDPGLGTLTSNGGITQTIALLAGSPAINAGDNNLTVDSQGETLPYDQRGPGYTRIVNGTVDIGAYEYQTVGPALMIASATFVPDVSDSNGTLVVTGSLAAEPDSTYGIQVFANPTGGQGQTLIGSFDATTDASGNVAFSESFTTADLTGEAISATVTDPNDTISQFPQGVTISSGSGSSVAVPLGDSAATTQTELQDVVSQLQNLPTGTTTPAIILQPTSVGDVDSVIAAINGLSGQPAAPITVVVDLGGQTYQSGTTLSPPSGVNVVIQNGTLAGDAPALTVASGNVTLNNVTATNTTSDPTILVTGGTLTVRNSTIDGSTVAGQAAFSITGGTVDLGTTSSPGGNTINISTGGQFLQNLTDNPVPTVGDTFTVNGTPLSAVANFDAAGYQLVASGTTENLVWYGTSGRDQVRFIQTGADTVQLNVNELDGVATSFTTTVTGVTGDVVVNEFDVAGDTDVVDGSGLTTISSMVTVGDGNDTIIGGGGANTIVAGNGDNTIYGNGIGNSPNAGVQDPSNTITVGDGDNIIFGNYSGSGYQGGDNTITAGDGNNTIYGNYANGGYAHDTPYGVLVDGAEGGDNTIRVGNGDNTIYGNYGNADGGEGGNNTIIAGDGNDVIFGNAGGNDPQRKGGDNFIQVGNGNDTIYGNFGGDGGEGGNNTILTGSGQDTIYGNFGGYGGEGGNNLIVAGGGDDTIYAHCGLPVTSGTSGTTAEGQDLIIGGTGTDTVYGWPAGYTLGANTGDLFIAGTTNLTLGALDTVLAEWVSSDDYATRVADLSGINGAVGANGGNYLVAGTTVIGSAAVDEVFGTVDSDDDWYLVTSNDVLNDVDPSDVTWLD